MSRSFFSSSRRVVSSGVALTLTAAGLLFGCEPEPTTTTDAAIVQSDAFVAEGDAGPAADAYVEPARDAGPAGDAGPSADAGPSVPELDIAGTYTDGFATHTIGGGRWTMSGEGFSSGFAILRVDNDEAWAIARNDASNTYSPNLYSRFEWVRVGGDLYICQAPFDAPSEDAALAAARPDRSSPATAGCGDFGWSQLTPITP